MLCTPAGRAWGETTVGSTTTEAAAQAPAADGATAAPASRPTRRRKGPATPALRPKVKPKAVARRFEVHGAGGLLTQLEEFEGTLFAFGGDLSYVIWRFVDVALGAMYVQVVAQAPDGKVTASLLAFDAGPRVTGWITPRLGIPLGIRVGSVQTLIILQTAEGTASRSDQPLIYSPTLGVKYKFTDLLGMDFEVRKPIYKSSSLPSTGLFILGGASLYF